MDVREEMRVLRRAAENGGVVLPGSDERTVQNLTVDGYVDGSGRITQKAYSWIAEVAR